MIIEELTEDLKSLRNDTCHRIVVAVISHRRVVVYEGYSPYQALIMENWCIDCGYDYRVINTDFAFERSV